MRQVAELYVVVPIDEAAMSFNAMLSFNESGALLWNRLDEDADREVLIETLLSEYEVDREQAQEDVDRFIEKLSRTGLLVE